MKIVRTEEGYYTRKTTLNIDETVAEKINSALEASVVSFLVGTRTKFEPLTPEDIWDIMTKSIDAPRFREEYFVNLKFYAGNMKLGDFVHCAINDIFAEIPGEGEETPDFYNDEFYP